MQFRGAKKNLLLGKGAVIELSNQFGQYVLMVNCEGGHTRADH